MDFGRINKHPIWSLLLGIVVGLCAVSFLFWPSYGGGLEAGIAIFLSVIAVILVINAVLGFRRQRSGLPNGDVQMRRRGFWKGFALAIALVLLWFLLVVPQYADYSSAIQTSEILALLEPTRARVGERVLRAGTVAGSGAGLVIPDWPESRIPIRFRHVTSDGVVIVQGAKKGQVVVLVPSLEGGKVVWVCVGGSARDVPSSCRP